MYQIYFVWVSSQQYNFPLIKTLFSTIFMLIFFTLLFFKYASLYQSMIFNFSTFDDDNSRLPWTCSFLIFPRPWHWTFSSFLWLWLPHYLPKFLFLLFWKVSYTFQLPVSYRKRNSIRLESLPTLVKSPSLLILSN